MVWRVQQPILCLPPQNRTYDLLSHVNVMPEQFLPQSTRKGRHVASLLALESWTVKINCPLQTLKQLRFRRISFLELLQIFCLVALQF